MDLLQCLIDPFDKTLFTYAINAYPTLGLFDIVAGTSIGAINATILVSYVIKKKSWEGSDAHTQSLMSTTRSRSDLRGQYKAKVYADASAESPLANDQEHSLQPL